ncbi:MAG: PKD domain-containing protein, partial [Bacteroidota bacterium]
PWDYDLAFYNADYCEGFLASGWAYNINYVCNDAGVPFWWERLNEDTLFRQHLACRWQSLRSTNEAMSDARLGYVIDSMANVLQEAHTRNFNYWPILGTYVWPNPGPLPDTYSGEVQKLKSWIEERAAWLDFALSQHLPQPDATFTATPVNALTWQFTAKPGWEYLWDFGDGTTSSEMSPVHTFASAGTRTVKLTISTPYGCSASSEQTILIVSVGTIATSGIQVQISPNPATDIITVKTSGCENTVTLYNQAGQPVQTAYIQKNEYELRLPVYGLPGGTYRLEVRGENGVANVMVTII